MPIYPPYTSRFLPLVQSFRTLKLTKNLYSASHLLFTKFLSAHIRSRVNEILRKPRTAIRKDATARCI